MRTRLLFLTLIMSLLAATPAWATHFKYTHFRWRLSPSGVQAATGAAPLNIPGVFTGNAYLNTAANVAAGLQLNGLPTMNVVATCSGDFNGDGIPDIVAAGNDPDPSRGTTVAWITMVLGNGDGTFGAPDVYTADDTKIFAVACADINGDGVTGVAVLGSAPDPANPGSQLAGVTVFSGQDLMNTPLGSDLPSKLDVDLNSTLVGTAGLPVSLQFANLDGDQRPDLVIATTDVADGLYVWTILSKGAPLSNASPFAEAGGLAAQIQRDPTGAIRGLRTLAIGSSNLLGAPLLLDRTDYQDVLVVAGQTVRVLANDTTGGLAENNPGGGQISLPGLNWGVAFDPVHGFQINAVGANGGLIQLTTLTPVDSKLGSGYQTPSSLAFGGTTGDVLIDPNDGTGMMFVLPPSLNILKQQSGAWIVDKTLALPLQPVFFPTDGRSAIYDVVDAALNDVETVEPSDASTGNPGGIVVSFPSSSTGYTRMPMPSGAPTTTSFVLSPASPTSCQALAASMTVAAASGTPSGTRALIIDGVRKSIGTVSGTTPFTIPALSQGTHVITLAFKGSSSWAGSNSSQTLDIAPCAAMIAGIQPASGPAGTTVTVLGTGFLAFAPKAACVGTLCTNATVLDDSHVTFPVTPTMQTGNVALSSSAQGLLTSGYVFTVGTQPPPTITGFTPSSGPTGTKVTLTGTHFTGATSWSFNGTPAPDLFVTSDTTATATVPALATSGPISITTPGGTATSAGSFVVGTGPVTHFVVPLSGGRSGVPFPISIRAADANGRTVTSFSEPVVISNSVPGATFGPVTWVNGIGTFTATFPPDPLPLTGIGAETLSVSLASNSLITGHAVMRIDDPGMVIIAHPTATLGTPTTVTVTAVDPGNQNAVITGYSGPVVFTSSDPSAQLPGPSLLTNGMVTVPVTLYAAGSQTITVNDASLPRINATATIQVAKITPTVSLNLVSSNPATVGQTATWSVSLGNTVSSVDPSGSATIAVTVTDTGGNTSTQSVSCTVDKSGACVTTMPTAVAGTYDAAAQYGGNANYNSASSGHVSLTVTKANVTANLGCSQNPSNVSQPVTCTLTVGGATQDASATTTVTINLVDLVGNTSSATQSFLVNAAGVGSFTPSTTVAGTYTLTATYPGNGFANKALSNPFVEIVNRDVVSESGSCSPNPSVAGTSFTCVVSLSGVDSKLSALAATTATMVLTDALGNQSKSTVPVTFNAAGTGTFTFSSLAGVVQVNVPYPGNANYAPAVLNNPISVTVKKISVGASLVCPGLATVSQKFTCTYTLSGGNTTVDASGPATATGSFTDLTGQTTPITMTFSLGPSGTGTFDQTPPAGGTYQFSVTSNGNANYFGATSSIVTVPAYNTPAGSSVPVTVGNVTLTFGEVTQPGNTTVGTSSSGPAPPVGFAAGTPALFYAPGTTATINGLEVICVDHSNQSFPGSAAPDIFELSPTTNTWVKITTSNTGSTTCGSTNVLSPVAVFQPVGCVNDLTATAITTAVRGGRVSTVTLYWTGIPAQSYTVNRNWTSIGNVTGSGYVDSGVSPGKAYEYFLRAAGSGCPSNPVSVTVPQQVTPPRNP